jgi:hypothetical protein
LLFTPLDEINILGVGYKARVKKQQNIALKEVNVLRKLDVVRMSILDVLGDVEFCGKIYSNYNRDTDSFGTYEVLTELCTMLESTFNRNFEAIDFTAGVISINNGVLDNSQLQNVPSDIRNVVDKCHKRNVPVNEKGQILSIPLKMEDNDTTFWIVYMKNTDKLFSKADQLLIQNAWRMIRNEVNMIILEFEALEDVPS